MKDSVQFKFKNKNGDRVYECPLCGDEILVKSSSFNGQCKVCKATIIDYKPAPHQLKFHQSTAQYRLNIGGFGSGKTTMCCAELAIHALSVPKGRSLITAPKLQQVRDAVIPELDKFLPKHLIKSKVTAPNIRYELENGHEILVYASNDEQNLRSINLTAFYIEEASNVDYSVFSQLQARLRNEAGIVFDEQGNEVGYNFMGLVSTNPDEGWVRSEFLLKAGKIFSSESIDMTGYDSIRARHGEPHYHAFISSSRDNHYLPKTFISRLIIGKTPAWVRKFIDCQLDIKEGAVYPEAKGCFVDPFPIPKTWPYIMGFDKGFRDETAGIFLAIDPKTNILYASEEYYQAERPISYHAHKIRDMMQDKIMYSTPKGDPTIRNRNERDGDTYQSYFQKVSGIYIEAGNNDITAGIEKVRDYMYLGRLKFFNTLENTKEEISSYVYQEDKDKPVDRKNHLMDALRYAIAQLPQNPMEFEVSAFSHDAGSRFWSEDWEEDEDVVSSGNVYMAKGGSILGL